MGIHSVNVCRVYKSIQGLQRCTEVYKVYNDKQGLQEYARYTY